MDFFARFGVELVPIEAEEKGPPQDGRQDPYHLLGLQDEIMLRLLSGYRSKGSDRDQDLWLAA